MKLVYENRKLIFFTCLFIFISNSCVAQSPQTIANIQISFVNSGTFTTFTLTSTLDGTLSDRWMAVGFNTAKKMV